MWNVSTFFCSLKASDTRRTREIKSRIVITKDSIQQQDSSHQTIGHKFKQQPNEVLRLEHSFV
jgi:hypothetical protein